MNPTTSKSRPCGCSGSGSSGASGSVPKAKSGSDCGCGCGGCGSCAGLTADDSACTSGTPEATDRKGPSAPSCLPPRPRFFAGEMVTDYDLTAVIDYQRAQSLLSNGVIGGWGVYCGFSLSIDPESCAVCVGPGIAFDARGRDLVRGAATKLGRPAAADVGRRRDPCDPCVTPPPPITLYLAVVYDDCLSAPKPRYGNACGPTSDPGCDYSRVEERTRLVWIDPNLVPNSYWTSGCLPDPCAEPEPGPNIECEQDPKKANGKCQEPALDRCTPDIGIHGGAGVDRYARALYAAWNLPRNAALVQSAGAQSNDGDLCCGVGVGALLDVMGGVACPPCTGEAVVVLGEVTFDDDPNTRRPRITVKPVRRRVLSNAALTYLVGFLLERALCPNASLPSGKPGEPPPTTEICGNPCFDAKETISRAAYVAVGKGAPEPVRERAVEKLAYLAVMRDRRAFQDFAVEDLLDVAKGAYARALTYQEEKDLHVRYQEVAGRAAYESAAADMIDLVQLPPASEQVRPAIKEYLVEQFSRLQGTHRTIGWLPFLGLVRKVHEMAGVQLEEAKVRRLAEQFPGARVPEERDEITQKQVDDLQKQILELRAQLDRAKGTEAAEKAVADEKPAVEAGTVEAALPAEEQTKQAPKGGKQNKGK